VSIVNPARIQGDAKSQLSRTKNDQADAALIARFCRDLKPSLWQPAPEAVAPLQTLSRCLSALEQMMTQEKNRRPLGGDDEALASDIQAHLSFLEGQVEGIKKPCASRFQLMRVWVNSSAY